MAERVESDAKIPYLISMHYLDDGPLHPHPPQCRLGSRPPRVGEDMHGPFGILAVTYDRREVAGGKICP